MVGVVDPTLPTNLLLLAPNDSSSLEKGQSVNACTFIITATTITMTTSTTATTTTPQINVVLVMGMTKKFSGLVLHAQHYGRFVLLGGLNPDPEEREDRYLPALCAPLGCPQNMELMPMVIFLSRHYYY